MNADGRPSAPVNSNRAPCGLQANPVGAGTWGAAGGEEGAVGNRRAQPTEGGLRLPVRFGGCRTRGPRSAARSSQELAAQRPAGGSEYARCSVRGICGGTESPVVVGAHTLRAITPSTRAARPAPCGRELSNLRPLPIHRKAVRGVLTRKPIRSGFLAAFSPLNPDAAVGGVLREKTGEAGRGRGLGAMGCGNEGLGIGD